MENLPTRRLFAVTVISVVAIVYVVIEVFVSGVVRGSVRGIGVICVFQLYALFLWLRAYFAAARADRVAADRVRDSHVAS